MQTTTTNIEGKNRRPQEDVKVNVLIENGIKDLIVGIKGAGDLATGVAWRLYHANIRKIFMMEIETPLAVRRQVSFCEAVHDGRITVEGVQAVRADHSDGIHAAWDEGNIPVVVDPKWQLLSKMSPHVVVDAILAKRNLGTIRNEAPLVIGLGPGFNAGYDTHAVIETKRGHNLGRVIEEGLPEANTGVPGAIGGYSSERLLRAPCSGIFYTDLSIGTSVEKGQVIGDVDGTPVTARISGMLRGLIRPGTLVSDKLKIGDVDPRNDPSFCPHISEKARAIAGGVLESILNHYNQ